MNLSETVTNEIYKNISNHGETKGFDLCAGAHWIYPLNYSIRDYQFNIVKNALFENTLVSLPTGLGKTFIAAVIMYNYFRWYPNGKIIFMAPTKPLVRQQIDACYNIVGIPKETTVELTGTIQQTTRAKMWRDKRVFFITPHVLQNDLNSMPEIADSVKCLVLDEAHKAKGTYAYCEVMRKLQERNKYFRVLALSATPGGTVREILEVAKTLYISHLEVKTDESVDVAPYVYKRSLSIINVPLDKKLYDVREEYLKIIEQYARVLIQNKVFTGNYSQLTKGRIFMTLKDYQGRKARNVNIPNYNSIMKSLNICLTLYHGLELLTRHGLRGFLLYYEEHIQKPLLRGNQALHVIINDLKEYLGPLPDWHPSPDRTIAKQVENIRFGHPKFRKLGDVLSAHFIENSDDTTRVIVFFEYKDSVLEAYALLLEYHPLVKARVFMGQTSITQKQQKTTLNIFRSGECNTLLSTSIGEEGLDVGEVDLIVCFDISSKSPIRMVQRMGRTGRKREGKIVVLITEGKEEELLRECLVQKKMLNESILNCSGLHTHLYQDCPKMVPDNLEPQCKKIHITVRKEEDKPAASQSAKTSAKRSSKSSNSNAIKTMFDSISCSQGGSIPGVIYPDVEDRLPQPRLLCLKEPDHSTKVANKQYIDFTKHLEKQRSWQSTFLVDHSQNGELLRSILQFADSKRFNIPQTQIERTKSIKTGVGMLQSDIRSMFLKQKQTQVSQLEVDVNLNEKVTEILIENQQYECSTNLQTEIRDYLTISYSNMFNCGMCDKRKQICNLFKNTFEENPHFNALSWTQPDESIFDYLNKDTLNKFLRQSKGETDKEDAVINEEDEFISTSLFDDIKFQVGDSIDAYNNFECRKDSTYKTSTVAKNNNSRDSFEDNDFFSADFLEDMLLENKNSKKLHETKDMLKQDGEKSKDFICKLINTTDKINKPVALNSESKSFMSKSHESTILLDDEFISSEILDDFNINSPKVKKVEPSKTGDVKSPEQKNISQVINLNSPKKTFKFKNISIKNTTRQDILNGSDFFADDILNELSSTNFLYKSSTSPIIGQNMTLNKSFKKMSEIHKNVVLADIIFGKNLSGNDTKKMRKQDFENVTKINCTDHSDDDGFMDFNSILAEIVKDSNAENDADSNDTILNSPTSGCEEENGLNQAFLDPESTSPNPKSNIKSIEESHKTPVKQKTSKNLCTSPELFCDSNPSTPELDKDVLDNSHDRTILFSLKSSTDNSTSHFENRSPCVPICTDSNQKSNDSTEKSPSLWNLSKIYTQTSRDINGRIDRTTSQSTDCIESLSFSESLFNNFDIPDDKILAKAPKRIERKPKVKRKLSLNSSLLDVEAMLDGSQSADEDETNLNDEYDASFVNDASQDVGNTTALHAFYLKSTRSPQKKQKGFKIPMLPPMNKMDIYSQIEPTQQDTYLEDSFCVDVLTQNITKEKEFDVLEEAERILKNRRRRKTSSNTKDEVKKKRRRRLLILSDSD